MSAHLAGGSRPLISLFVHPDHVLPGGFRLDQLEGICVPALAAAMAVARDGAPILNLDEIEVTLLSDELMADVHLEFMSIEGPTDVITFDHGEVLIGTGAAAAQAAGHGNSIEKETATYLVHGLLHLSGFADKSPEDFAEMAERQQAIVDQIWVAA